MNLSPRDGCPGAACPRWVSTGMGFSGAEARIGLAGVYPRGAPSTYPFRDTGQSADP
jgi:hypothetical protein